MSPTLLRADGYRFYFYSRETREPPHVHVQRGEAEAKFWLRPVRLATSDGFTTRQLARIEAVVRAHRAEFVRTWETYFRDYPDQHQPDR